MTKVPSGLAGEGGGAFSPSTFLFAGPFRTSHVGSVLGDSLFFNLILRGPSLMVLRTAGTCFDNAFPSLGSLKISLIMGYGVPARGAGMSLGWLIL